MSDGRDCYRLGIGASIHFGRPEHLVADLRRSVGWRDGYLFVPSDGGGGNAWKGVTEVVFMVRAGRLVPLGSLIARTDRAVVGSCYRDRLFFDIDDELEGNDLTSHAGAPCFDLVLRERDGRLVVDPERTWAENRTRLQHNDSLARAAVHPADANGSWETVLSPLLENAVIARFCGRASELEVTLAEARRRLPGWGFDGLQKELAKVEPGRLPRSCSNVGDRCRSAPHTPNGR